MRKSGVIAVVALGIGGVLVSALRPKRDWVEYHIRQYREAERKFTSPETFLDEVRDTLPKIRSKGIGRQGRLFIKMKEHRAALIRLGYLEERIFVVTNALPDDFADALRRAAMKKGTNTEFYRAIAYPTPSTNAVTAITVKGLMPTWEEIREEMKSIAPTGQ